MKMLIIGLDGLDPDLVERWDLKFKQNVWGRHYVGFVKELSTPILWGCFLTGVNVETRGYSSSDFEKIRQKEMLKSRLLKVLYPIRRRIPVKLGVRGILVKLGLVDPYASARLPSDLLKITFIEELKAKGFKVGAIEVPSYNERINVYFRSRTGRLVTSNASFSERKKLIEEALEEVRNRISRAEEFMDEDYDMIFVYSMLPDIAFHMIPKPRIREIAWVRSVLSKLERIVMPIVMRGYSEGYSVLIVSDHGFDFKKYDHTEYGFWSLNYDLGWNVSSILDFKKNILKVVINDFKEENS